MPKSYRIIYYPSYFYTKIVYIGAVGEAYIHNRQYLFIYTHEHKVIMRRFKKKNPNPFSFFVLNWTANARAHTKNGMNGSSKGIKLKLSIHAESRLTHTHTREHMRARAFYIKLLLASLSGAYNFNAKCSSVL